MKNGIFPLPKIDHWREDHAKIEEVIKNPLFEGVAEVEVDATNVCGVVSHVPYLGTVDETYGRFVFPLGRWKTKYTFFEIRAALRFGYRFKYIKAAVYLQATRQPFAKYVDFCYAIRDEGTKTGDKILRDIGKSLGNNLFGKFGHFKHFPDTRGIGGKWFFSENMLILCNRIFKVQRPESWRGR